MSTPAQAAASRRNGAHSHGPVTREGKARSAKNRLQHGFRGFFTVLPAEDQFEFDALMTAFRDEHQPATPTECILVDKMAQHHWLSRRAQALQDASLEDPKVFALYLRYQTANDCGFSKCLSDLLKFRAEKRKQQQQAAAEQRNQETHDARVRTVNAKAEQQELETSIQETIEAALPGRTPIPFTLFKQFLAGSLEQFAQELDRHPELLTSGAAKLCLGNIGE